MLSLFPAYRFAGWQWVLVVLAAPVALWAAWPFHRAALKNARHGACSMDTLVSLGVVAASPLLAHQQRSPVRSPRRAGGGLDRVPAGAYPCWRHANSAKGR